MAVRFYASLGFWYFLLFVIVWRQLMKLNPLQRFVHRAFHGRLAPCLQWYSIYFVGILGYMLYSIQELLTQYDSLPDEIIEDNLRAIWSMDHNAKLRNETTYEEFTDPLIIRPWLRCINLASQFVGVPVVVIAMVHVWKLLAVPAHRMASGHEHWREVPWKPTTRMNWLMLVITMPAMFSVSSMRASCRVLALMTGTAYGHSDMRWQRVIALETAMYHSDLELAALFQFSTVYAFARICGSILSDRAFFTREGVDSDAFEYTWALKTAGFLGVWAFVVVGILRSLFSFVVAQLEQIDDLQIPVSMIQERIFQKISTVFSAITMLCVLNMIVICKMSIITDRLGNASQKFQGTRILLICGEMQAKILDVFTVGSAMYQTVHALVERRDLPLHRYQLHRWNFSTYQANLFHLSLLNFECLVVVCFNLFTWYRLDLLKSGVLNFKPLSNLNNNNEEEQDEEHIRKTKVLYYSGLELCCHYLLDGCARRCCCSAHGGRIRSYTVFGDQAAGNSRDSGESSSSTGLLSSEEWSSSGAE